MLIKEYRILLPISVEEYQVGQLYAVAEASKNETGGGEGVEVLENRPYEEDGEKGQYTHKVYHLQSKVPKIVGTFAPKGSLMLEEKAWNAYPYCKTVLTNLYMAGKFEITIQTWHKPDMGDQENVHGLEKSKWDNVEVVNIDIADKKSVETKDYNPEQDPAIFRSEKTGRGPLKPGWQEELANNPNCPHMCAYKLVSIRFEKWGFQSAVEPIIQRVEKRIFTHFHRQLFCWIDKWIDLSMDDIRRMEDDTKKELDEMRDNGEVRGMSAE